MSKISVRKEISDIFLERLSSEANKALRGSLEKGRVQVLRLDNLDFINATINKLKEQAKLPESTKSTRITAQMIEDARDLARPYQDLFVGRRKNQNLISVIRVQDTLEYKRLAQVRPSVTKEIDEGISFLVESFDTIAVIKKKIVDRVLQTRTEEVKKLVSRNVERGHGAEGGDAVSHLQLAEAAAYAAQSGVDLAKTPGLDKFLLKQFKTLEFNATPKQLTDIVKSILTQYQTLVDSKGNISKDYIPIISLQDWFTNKGIDSKTETKMVEFARDFFTTAAMQNKLVNMSGSLSLKDVIEVTLMDTVAGTKKKKNRKVSRSVKGKPDYSRKTAKSKENKSSKPSVKTTNPSGGSFKGALKNTPDNTVSLPKIFAILTSRINEVVAKNMGSPALNYRTGRFANSVKIVDILPTAQGYPSVAYTYMRNPYQVFEKSSGSRFASVDRDPRKLIDYSIREIASQLVTGRLYTRRI